MSTKTEIFNKTQLKENMPDIRPGDTVRISQKIPTHISSKTGSATGGKEKEKEKIQAFEGLVIAKKHGKGISATITIRKIISGIGVEKIFPIHLPTIEKIEILKRTKVKRAKLYYLRKVKGKKARLKRKELAEAVVWEKPTETAQKTEKEEEMTAETEAKTTTGAEDETEKG